MRWVPNAVSLLRLLLSPFVPLLFYAGEEVLGSVLFSLLALSDALDGLVARVLRAETFLGRLLDPLADKVLLLSGLLSALYFTDLDPLLLKLVVARDLTIVLGSLVLMRYGFVPSPSPVGKLTTLSLSLTVLLSFLGVFTSVELVKTLGDLLYKVSLLLVVLSWIDYTVKGVQFAMDRLIMERR